MTPVVLSLLARTRANCLVRSVVLQHWFAANGETADVVIGVSAPSGGFRAHAWLDRPDTLDSEGFVEIHRLTFNPSPKGTGHAR